MVKPAQKVGWLHRQPFVERPNSLRKLILKTLFCSLEEIELWVLARHDNSSTFLRHYSEFNPHWIEEVFIFADLAMLVQSHVRKIWMLLGQNLHPIRNYLVSLLPFLIHLNVSKFKLFYLCLFFLFGNLLFPVGIDNNLWVALRGRIGLLA